MVEESIRNARDRSSKNMHATRKIYPIVGVKGTFGTLFFFFLVTFAKHSRYPVRDLVFSGLIR